MGKCLVGSLCLFIAIGCSGGGAEMQSGRQVVGYPELDELDNSEAGLAVGYAATGGPGGGRPDWGKTRKAASSDEYQALLAKFEAAEPPSPVTEEQKQAVVAAAKKLGEDLPDAETQAAYDEYRRAIATIRRAS